MLALILLVLCDLVFVGIFAISFNLLPPEIPLYYSHEWGERQLGSKWELLLVPFIANVFYLYLHFVRRREMKQENIIMAHIISVLNIIQLISLTFVFLRIIFIVIW